MARRIGGKRKLRFRTTENKKSARRRAMIAVFSLAVLIIAAVSVFVIGNEYNWFDKNDADDKPLSDDAVSKLSGTPTMMFAGVSTSEDEVDFIALITLNVENRSFIVSAVSPKEKYNGNTLSEIYATTDAEELLDATQNITGINIDRYAVVTEKNFKGLMTSLGLPEFEIKNKINYDSEDFSLNLLAGEQTIPGDKLYKYIQFTGLGGSDYEMREQASIIGEIISQRLNETNTGKGEELFAALINKCHSDITIVDFTKYYGLLSEISAEPRTVEILSYTAERD